MMVKDDSLYVIAIVAVVAVVGLVIMATGSTVVAKDLPSMVDNDDTAIAGQASYVKSHNKFQQSGPIAFNDAEWLVTYFNGLSGKERTNFIQTLGFIGIHCDDTR
jgi:hypothetical protein